MLSQAQIAKAWGPACQGSRATVTLHGGGRVSVRSQLIEATKALNSCLVSWNYRAHASQTGGYNCLAYETEILTRDGIRRIGDLAGQEIEVLQRRANSGTGKGGPGTWVKTTVENFGQDLLYKITLSSSGVEKVIYATRDHRWYTKGSSTDPYAKEFECTTEELVPGYRLSSLRPQSIASRTEPSPVGICAGLVFGDGTVDAHNARIQLHGEKNVALRKYFSPEQVSYKSKVEDGDDLYTIIAGLPRSWKTSGPNLTDGPCTLYGWLAGYFAADGRVTKDGSVELNSYTLEHLEMAREVALKCGITTRPITSTKKTVAPPGGDKEYTVTQYNLNFHKKYLDESFFLIEDHRKRFVETISDREPNRWKVVSVEKTPRYEDVYCVTVPNDSFALADDILTGNCRKKVGGSGWSNHAYGTAIDINWNQNRYSSRLITDMPSAMVQAICRIRTNNGKQVWNWGGYWKGNKDCLSGDTMVVTRDGNVPIRDLAGQVVEILSTKEDPTTGSVESEWVKAPVESYGWDETYTLTFRRRNVTHSVRCNAGHRWPIQGKDGEVRLVTTKDLNDELKQGDGVVAMQFPELESFTISPEFVAKGIVWGDGSVYNTHGSRVPRSKVQLCGSKASLREWIEPFAGYWSETEQGPTAWKMPAWLKALPGDYSSIGDRASFFMGWFATDGCMKGYVPTLSTSSLEALSWIKTNAPELGLTITNVTKQDAGKSGFNSTKDNYTVAFRHVDKKLLLREDHQNLWVENDRAWFKWQLDQIEKNEGVEEIFCATVDGRGVFALATSGVPILTGNSMHMEIVCSPADIRTGINWNTVSGHKVPPANIDWAAVRRLTAGAINERLKRAPNLNIHSRDKDKIKALQEALNLVGGAGLAVDGIYGSKTVAAVLNFQRWMNGLGVGIPDFPGAAHEGTRWWLVIALESIRLGRA